jgi:hypothetical protein
MSGRYQSKVFNFLSRQSLRLRDRSAQTWRQSKIAAVWGVQILLYPIYVGFQTARLAEKQLRQAIRQLPLLLAAQSSTQSSTQAGAQLGSESTPAALSDAPIRAILQALSLLEVRPSALPEHALPEHALPEHALPEHALPEQLNAELTHSIQQSLQINATEVLVITESLTATLQIQGLASMLGTGQLVLVTTQNQILDILTSDQQTQINQRLIWEMASYHRQQRRFKPSSSFSTYLPLPKPQPNALPPIRAFRALMTWMQLGAVAISADLFQESQLALRLVESSKQQSTQETPALAAAQELRSAQPVWEATEAQFYDWLGQTGQAASQILRAAWASGLTAWQKRSLQEGLQQFQANLTQAQAQMQAGYPVQPYPVQPYYNRATNWVGLLDQWLSEVPGLKAPDSLPNTLPNTSPITIVPTETQLPDWEVTDTGVIEVANQAQVKTYHPVPISRTEPNHTNLTTANQGQTPATRPTQTPALSNRAAKKANETVVPSQAWIETDAQLVSYDKHPLEQLLAWLDQGMSWLETRLAKLWQWLRRSQDVE